MSSKIGWCTNTVNPLGWGCYGPGGTPKRPKVCWYCYAKALAMRNLTDCPECRAFKPHFHRDTMDKVWKNWIVKPREIFWQSMGDLWHPHTPREYIMEVLLVLNHSRQHTHLFLTKNPKRYLEFAKWIEGFGDKLWLGTTITSEKDLVKHSTDIMSLGAMGFNTYLSIEPMLAEVESLGAYLTDCSLTEKRIHGVILGGQNHNGYCSITMPLSPSWVTKIRDDCQEAGVPFFFKGWGHHPGQIYPKHLFNKRMLDGREHNDLAWRLAK